MIQALSTSSLVPTSWTFIQYNKPEIWPRLNNQNYIFQLDTLVRVLVDRKWTVGQLARAVLKFARQSLHEPHVIPDNHSLFDELIGIEKFPDDT